MGMRLAEYLSDFVPCLHNILRSPTVNKEIKLPAIHALGDLSLCCEDQFNGPYLQDTLVIYKAAAEMSVMANDDPETAEFLRDLRQEILEQYGTLLVAAGDSAIPQVKSSIES